MARQTWKEMAIFGKRNLAETPGGANERDRLAQALRDMAGGGQAIGQVPGGGFRPAAAFEGQFGLEGLGTHGPALLGRGDGNQQSHHELLTQIELGALIQQRERAVVRARIGPETSRSDRHSPYGGMTSTHLIGSQFHNLTTRLSPERN